MLIATDRPVPENSKVWFLDCIKDAFLNTLSTLLQFITAFKQFPAWWLHKKTVLKFLPDTDKKYTQKRSYVFIQSYFQLFIHRNMHSSKT